MNKENIFKHIEGEQVPLQETIKIVKKRTNKIYLKIGMFIKMIANSNLFIEKFRTELGNENIEPDNEEMLINKVKKIVYTKAYGHLSQVDFNNKSQLKIALKFEPKIMKASIYKALEFFESEEDYVKCHLIHEFKVKVEDLKNNLEVKK